MILIYFMYPHVICILYIKCFNKIIYYHNQLKFLTEDNIS